MTQEELADATGVPQRTISNYERMEPKSGKSRISKISVQSLADFFGVTARYLLGQTDNPEYDTRGTDGDRSRRQLVAIHDALPPELRHGLVESARSQLRYALEVERIREGEGPSHPEVPSS